MKITKNYNMCLCWLKSLLAYKWHIRINIISRSDVHLRPSHNFDELQILWTNKNFSIRGECDVHAIKSYRKHFFYIRVKWVEWNATMTHVCVWANIYPNNLFMKVNILNDVLFWRIVSYSCFFFKSVTVIYYRTFVSYCSC